ncbi:MAG: short-chain dehydrogenase, partial [Acidimicrobiia bacterium]|nr:short-chain dehydrogenase [Acidimicrobiia bacterium]
AMVVYRASEENEGTHEIFSAGGGRFARFFVGVNRGWNAAGAGPPTAEDVRDHLDEIRDISTHEVFGSSAEELALLAGLLGG